MLMGYRELLAFQLGTIVISDVVTAIRATKDINILIHSVRMIR